MVDVDSIDSPSSSWIPRLAHCPAAAADTDTDTAAAVLPPGPTAVLPVMALRCRFYSEVFPPSQDAALLDLCSSWISHYPTGLQAKRVAGQPCFCFLVGAAFLLVAAVSHQSGCCARWQGRAAAHLRSHSGGVQPPCQPASCCRAGHERGGAQAQLDAHRMDSDKPEQVPHAAL